MPKIVDKEKRKKEISEKALKIFAEKGFDAASVSDIANEADMAKGTLYDYFSSKDDLIFFSISHLISEVWENSENFSQIENPLERLRKMITSSINEFIQNPAMIKMSYSIFQLLLNDKYPYMRRQKLYKKTIEPYKKIIENILKEGVKKKIFNEYVFEDSGKLALNILSSMDGMALYCHMMNRPGELEEQVNIYLDYLIQKDLLKDSGGDKK